VVVGTRAGEGGAIGSVAGHGGKSGRAGNGRAGLAGAIRRRSSGARSGKETSESTVHYPSPPAEKLGGSREHFFKFCGRNVLNDRPGPCPQPSPAGPTEKQDPMIVGRNAGRRPPAAGRPTVGTKTAPGFLVADDSHFAHGSVNLSTVEVFSGDPRATRPRPDPIGGGPGVSSATRRSDAPGFRSA
jgi:hypothetical protein